MPTVDPLALPFREAIDFYRQKSDRLPTERWDDLWQDQHERAFVVAGATRDAMLADLQAAINKGLTEGTTLADFRKRWPQITAGWTGWTGEDTPAGRRWRQRVIFDTNVRTAYAAGRWQQIQEARGRRPWLRYVATLDERTRPHHREWHGTVLPVDHSFWQTHYPPNGWLCRCTVEQLSDRDLRRYGYTPSSEAPPLNLEEVEVRGRGSVMVPQGIDPGWAYAPGAATWQDHMAVEAAEAWQRTAATWRVVSPGDWRSAGRPAQLAPEPTAAVPAREAPADQPGLLALAKRAIGAAWRLFHAPGGDVLVSAAALSRTVRPSAAVLPLLPEAIQQPQEVWAAFEADPAGALVLRRRWLRSTQIAGGGAIVIMAQAVGGVLETWGVVPADAVEAIGRWRVGRLLISR